MVDSFVQDLRYAWRHVRRAPGFAAAAILTLAFGIGANTAMLTLLNALVFRELPIRDPGGLLAVTTRDERGRSQLTPILVLEELGRNAGPLQHLCAYSGGFVIATEAAGSPLPAIAGMVTGGCFATFGITLIAGRAIDSQDAPLAGQGARVAVISHRYWTRAFGNDPNVVGQSIKTEGLELTVVGVAPQGFGGLQVDAGVDIFAPFDTIFPVAQSRRPSASEILGRLRPGVSLEQATSELTTRWPALLAATVSPSLSPADRDVFIKGRPSLTPMGTGLSSYRSRYAPALTIVLGLTTGLLLLTGINLGGLLLARLTARTSEVAVRLALGGSQWRISQQMLLESLLLSLAGAVLAIPLASATTATLASFMPPLNVDRTVAFTPDAGVLIATAFTGVIVGVLMSAIPVSIAMPRLARAGVTWHRTIVGSTNRWSRALLVAQVALSVVMVVGAGLLTRSLYLLQNVDLGVTSENVLTVKLSPVPNGYTNLRNAAYYPQLLDKIASLPGVRSAGFSRVFPWWLSSSIGQPISFVGEPAGDVNALLELTSPGFFETVGIPLRRGRFTSWQDNESTRDVAIVSESLARALAPDGDILERRVKFSQAGHEDVVIVGVVGNATLGNPRVTSPQVLYRPALQERVYPVSPTVAIATYGDFARVSAAVRQVLSAAGREYAQEIVPLDAVFARAPAGERMSTAVAGAVAGLAVLLALIGIHGALAYAVSRRTREIGVRVAVGASPLTVARMVAREGIVVTSIGLVIGLLVALFAAGALRSLMFGVSEADPVTFLTTAAFFLVVGIASGAVPAFRASRVDPMVALRAE